MSDKREFHAAISRLAHARASNTLQYILTEAQRIEAKSRERRTCHICGQIFNVELIAEMICDPAIRMLAHGPDGAILNICRQQAAVIGKQRTELLGADLWALFPQEVAAQRRSIAESVQANGMPAHVMDYSTYGPDQPLESVVVPMAGGRILVLNRPLKQPRIFEQAFSESARVIE